MLINLRETLHGFALRLARKYEFASILNARKKLFENFVSRGFKMICLVHLLAKF